MVGEGGSVSWGGARTKGELHKRKLTKKMFLHIYLFKSMSSSLTKLCFTIIKLVLQGNGVKRYRAINQSNHNIHKFDLRQTLPKCLKTILNKFEVLMILDNVPILLNY